MIVNQVYPLDLVLTQSGSTVSGTLQVVRCLGFSGLVPQSFSDFDPPSHC